VDLLEVCRLSMPHSLGAHRLRTRDSKAYNIVQNLLCASDRIACRCCV
jgi:hypothetical protein